MKPTAFVLMALFALLNYVVLYAFLRPSCKSTYGDQVTTAERLKHHPQTVKR